MKKVKEFELGNLKIAIYQAHKGYYEIVTTKRIGYSAIGGLDSIVAEIKEKYSDETGDIVWD